MGNPVLLMGVPPAQVRTGGGYAYLWTGGTPILGQDGKGYPDFRSEQGEYPHPRSEPRGTLILGQDGGPPIGSMGYPRAVWGTPHPGPRSRQGVPQTGTI